MIKITMLLMCMFLSQAFSIERFARIEKCPDFNTASQFIHNQNDYGRPTILINSDTFFAAVKDGDFLNTTPDDIYKSEKYPYDINLGSYQGAFSLKNGELYLWSMPRRGVIEIRNNRGQIAWIILKKDITGP